MKFLTPMPQHRPEWRADKLLTPLICRYATTVRGHPLVQTYAKSITELIYGKIEKGTLYTDPNGTGPEKKCYILFISELHHLSLCCLVGLATSYLVPTVSKLITPLPDINGLRQGEHLCSALHLMNGFKHELLDEMEEDVDCYDECKVNL